MCKTLRAHRFMLIFFLSFASANANGMCPRHMLYSWLIFGWPLIIDHLIILMCYANFYFVVIYMPYRSSKLWCWWWWKAVQINRKWGWIIVRWLNVCTFAKLLPAFHFFFSCYLEILLLFQQWLGCCCFEKSKTLTFECTNDGENDDDGHVDAFRPCCLRAGINYHNHNLSRAHSA